MFKSFGVYALIMFHRSQNGSGPTLTDDILSFNEVNADSSKSNNLSEKISSYSEAFQVSVPKVEFMYSGMLKTERPITEQRRNPNDRSFELVWFGFRAWALSFGFRTY